ncbi:MAG: tyrosine--tRNA ligase [Spirochaetaceae bacterium]|nr:tyrosine--tRNA ligase [Spirochaetaceae bacterium]
MNQALQILQDRGFIRQCTNLEGLSRAMDERPLAFYIGCDPTGSSLHIGHMVPFFALRHLRAAGHTGIALVGGGTARIGDPSGKTEMRKVLSYDEIDHNAQAIEAQLDRFIGFDGKTAFTANNKDWLAGLNYIDFLRDIGSHFSVNRMLTFESYKKRLETGLTFVEFNYQLLQSYDFLELYRRHNCRLQIGGDDQWGNIVAGMELIRRIEGAEVFGLTFPLVTTADGKKMGKTEKGALFLDPTVVSPYEFFQYWRNVVDADVLRFLLMFTFLPEEECQNLVRENAGAEGAPPSINEAKERLAYEVTALIHGRDEAEKARAAARAMFGGGADRQAVPAKPVSAAELAKGIAAIELFAMTDLCASKAEARRLIAQGGALVNDRKIESLETLVDSSWLREGELLLKAGKKRFFRLVAE